MGTAVKITDPVDNDTEGAREIGFELPDQYNASAVLFDNLDKGFGDRIAVYSDSGNLTYSELCARANQVANAFSDTGLERGDRVLLFLEDTPTYPAVIFGLVRAGFVPLLINTQSPPELIQFFLSDSGAKAVVVDQAFASHFGPETFEGTSVEIVIWVNGEISIADVPDIRNGDGLFADASADFQAVPTHRDDMAFWMYSSGSTGKPKGVVHLHHDIPYIAESFGRHILDITHEDICFSVPKIFFAYGFGNSIAFPFAVGAGTVLMSGRPTPDTVFDTAERFSPTIFYGLPTLYRALIDHERFESVDLSSVRLFLSAAEILSEEAFNTWKIRFDREIVEGLGSTEALHIYLSNRPGATKPGAAGQRVPGYEVKLTDLEGNPVSQGEEGVLWLRTDSSAPCYWNRPEKTAETMRDDWLWTGDQFVEDEDGYFFFKGRADDLVKVSGQWVYPMEIEVCLSDHPKVKECAVFGVPLEDQRTTILAIVSLNDVADTGDDTTADLQRYVKDKLLPYKYPRVVEYAAELPKTGSGKIDRQALLTARS